MGVAELTEKEGSMANTFSQVDVLPVYLHGFTLPRAAYVLVCILQAKAFVYYKEIFRWMYLLQHQASTPAFWRQERRPRRWVPFPSQCSYLQIPTEAVTSNGDIAWQSNILI